MSGLLPGNLLTVDLPKEEAKRKDPFENVWFYNSLCMFNRSRDHMHPLKTSALLFVQVSKLFQAVCCLVVVLKMN